MHTSTRDDSVTQRAIRSDIVRRRKTRNNCGPSLEIASVTESNVVIGFSLSKLNVAMAEFERPALFPLIGNSSQALLSKFDGRESTQRGRHSLVEIYSDSRYCRGGKSSDKYDAETKSSTLVAVCLLSRTRLNEVYFAGKADQSRNRTSTFTQIPDFLKRQRTRRKLERETNLVAN